MVRLIIALDALAHVLELFSLSVPVHIGYGPGSKLYASGVWTPVLLKEKCDQRITTGGTKQAQTSPSFVAPDGLHYHFGLSRSNLTE